MLFLGLKKPTPGNIVFLFFSWVCEVGKSARKTPSPFRQHDATHPVLEVKSTPKFEFQSKSTAKSWVFLSSHPENQVISITLPICPKITRPAP